MESAKYKLGGANDQISGDGGPLATVYEKGSKLGLEPLDYGDTNLVGLWTFDEGSGGTAYDYSGNAATGSWTGIPSYTTGKVGSYAGSFNGTNNEVLVNSSVANIGNSATISLWANPTSLSSIEDLLVENTSGNWRIRIGGGYGNSAIMFLNGWSYFRYSSGGMQAGQWTNVVFVYSSGHLDAYINGALSDGTPSGPFASVSGSNQMVIGLTNYAGFLDDVRIYNRALSATEIAAMYAGGK